MTINISNVVMGVRVPDEAGSWYTMANDLMNSGDYNQAIPLYDKVINTSPTCAMAYHNKGDCLDQLGKLDDAIRCYDKAIEIDPYDSESWFNKGLTLRTLGNHEGSSYCAERAIDLAMGRIGDGVSK